MQIKDGAKLDMQYHLINKYQTRSLLEYAVKKEQFLLEVRKTIDTGYIITIDTEYINRSNSYRFTKFHSRQN